MGASGQRVCAKHTADGTTDRLTVYSLVVHGSVFVQTQTANRLTQHRLLKCTLSYMFRLFQGHDTQNFIYVIIEMQLLTFEYNTTNHCVNSLHICHVAVSFVWHVVNYCCVLSNITDATKIKISVLIILRTINLPSLFLLYTCIQPQDGSCIRNM